MKKLIFILCFFLFSFFTCHFSFSQTWQTYDSLRIIYLEKQSYDTALVYAEKALQVVPEDTNKVTLLLAIGDVYEHKQPVKAAGYYRRALYVAQLINNPLYKAGCFEYLGLLYMQGLAKYDTAEVYYLECLKIRKKFLGEKHPDYASSLGNLANLYWKMGNYPAAEPLLLEAMNIRKEVLGEKHPDYANSLNNLAASYYEMGNSASSEKDKADKYSAAESLYLEAMNIRKEVLGEKHPNYAQSVYYLAKLYKAMGNYTAAEPLFLEAKNILKEVLGEKHPNYAKTLYNLAGLYETMGNYTAAEPLYIEAKNILKEILGEKHPDYALSLNNLANLYRVTGNYTTSGPLFLECLETINSNIAQNFAFLSENEKEMYFKTQARKFADFYSFSLKYKTENPEITSTVFNNVVKNKGLLLKSSTAMRTAILNSKDTALISQYEKWIALKKEISKLYSTEISKRKNNPEELEQQANAIEKELVKGSQVFSDFEKLQNLTWESVKNSLKPGEAAIEFIHFRNSGSNSGSGSGSSSGSGSGSRDTVLYCALIITPESKQPEMIRLFEEQEIKTIIGVSDLNNFKYVNGVYGTNQSTNEALYKIIWQPLEPYLKDVKTVYYSPDGILHKVSFAALGKGKNIYLCDNFNLQQVSSTGKVAMPESTIWDEKLTAGLIGGIEYSTDTTTVKIWNYLPGTKAETDKIAGIFKKKKIGTTYLSGTAATEDTIKSIASNCNILHVSTHGFFYPEPEQQITEEKTEEKADSELVAFRGGNTGFGLWQFARNKNPLMRSGLALAGANNVWNQRFVGEGEDGVLTAQEVTQLDLSKTKLVVLSACETGLGDIRGSEGVYGLQRAFKMAGAKYIIMSLWQVPDKETVEFMEMFYKKLLKKKDVRSAFNETQKEMRKKYDPYYWAAFVLIE